MKILVINWRCIKNPEAGGAEIHLHEIFKRIVNLGHSVTLVSHSFKGALKEEVVDGIKIFRTGNRFLFHIQFKIYYKRNLKNQNYDLVVDYITKIPLDTPKYIKKPIVAALMHIHGKSLFKELPFFLSYYIYKKEKRIPCYYKNTPFFVISPSTKNDLVNIGFDENKIEFLYSGIDQDLFKEPSPKSQNPTLLYFGRIKKYKNIEIIIDALPEVIKSVPNVKLEIAGFGDHEKSLLNYIEKKNLKENVIFHGKVSEQKKVELMGKAWLLLIMSHKEGWGIVVIEANACFTPAIGSNVPGLRDSISEKTGLLSPVDDARELANKIVSLINEPNKLKEMSLAAKEWSNKFTWDASAKHFLKIVFKYFPNLNKGE